METIEKKHSLISNKFLASILPPCILAFLTAVIYWPSMSYPFQFDDIANISKRFSIRFDNPLTRWWGSARWLGDWLNSLNFQIGRFDPFYYRFFNLIIHILAGLCVFYLVLNLCKFLTKRLFFYENALFIAFATSGLFLLHPVQTQTVSYVIQARLEGLATLFVLATLLVFVKMIQAKTIIKKTGFGVLCVLFGILSCGTKELVVVIPFMMLLIDWFFISQQEWSQFKKRVWIHVGFAAFFATLIIHYLGWQFVLNAFTGKMSTGNNRGNILTESAFDVITPWTYLISEFRVIVHYLAIFLFPMGMSVEYDWKIASSFFSFQVIIPLMLLTALFSFVIYSMSRKQYPALTFGLLWFFIAVAPRSTILPSPELVCDYKTYLASMGMMFLLASVLVFLFINIWALIKNLPVYLNAPEAKLGILATLLLTIGLPAYQRNKVWETCVAFWEDNAKKAPNKARVHNNFGVALSEAGRVDESIVAYQKAISLDAHYADPLSNLAVAYSLKNDVDKAIEALKGAIHICPNYAEAYNNLGTLFLQKKQYADAEQSLQIAIQIRPYYGKAFYNLARLHEEKGDLDKSFACLQKATQGDLDVPEVYFKLGQMSLKTQKYTEAAQAFERVIQLGQAQDQVWFNLANAYYMLGQHDRAQTIYERLVKNNPLDSRYAYNLAETHFVRNDFVGAANIFKKITTLPQPVPQAFFRIVHCLEKMNKIEEAKNVLQELAGLNAAEDFKKMVSSELTRVKLQEKVNEGKGSIKLQDFKDAIAQQKTA